MGFLESFNRSFNKETDRLSRERERVEEEEKRVKEKKERLSNYRDQDLLNRVKYAYGEDKYLIEKILIERGYSKETNGVYNRK